MNTNQQIKSRVDRFLETIDNVTGKLGANVPQLIDIEKLRLLPIGTFGRAVADSLDSQNFTPFTTGTRRKQLHDSIHVVTGYSTDPIGEAQVQAFLLGTKLGITNLIIGLGTIRLSLRTKHKYQLSNQEIFQRLSQAYHRGRNSKLDPDKWQPELQWDWSLESVREFYRV